MDAIKSVFMASLSGWSVGAYKKCVVNNGGMIEEKEPA